jgi:hypothetical protein
MFNILQPKLRHQFMLQVTDADGSYNPEYDIFATQLISVDLGSELLLEGSPKQHKTNRIVLWLEDDATCKLIRTIRNMQAEPRQVNVDVFLVNGNEDVLERYSYKLATIEAMQHSMFSYAGVEDRIALQAIVPQTDIDGVQTNVKIPLEGHVTSSQSKSCSMKLLQFFFLGFEHQIYDEPCNVRAILAKIKEPVDGK